MEVPLPAWAGCAGTGVRGRIAMIVERRTAPPRRWLRWMKGFIRYSLCRSSCWSPFAVLGDAALDDAERIAAIRRVPRDDAPGCRDRCAIGGAVVQAAALHRDAGTASDRTIAADYAVDQGQAGRRAAGQIVPDASAGRESGGATGAGSIVVHRDIA